MFSAALVWPVVLVENLRAVHLPVSGFRSSWIYGIASSELSFGVCRFTLGYISAPHTELFAADNQA